ncbi:MAG: hypothetical protein A4E53_01175 [Pelotomaculum sp. PtaB.Bin104]|nr:MAG: hypothetical protein A4E53_01175 [Pelotomaculum sp. PtaB.Bin104]
MTFKQLTKIEPRLQQLYNEARKVKVKDDSFCANSVWYRQFKPRLLELVGFGAAWPELQSPTAYDVAYQTIYNALPNCGKRCSCI